MPDISKKALVDKLIDLRDKLNRRPKKRDDISLNYYAKKRFGSWNKLMKSAGFQVKFYQKISSINFNEDFAYFLGLIITDGHIVYDLTNKKYKVAVYTSYPKEKEMLLKLINDIFKYKAGVRPRMYGYNKKPNYEIRINSKSLAKLLVNKFEIMSGAKSLIIKIPKIMLKSNKIIKGSFLRGIIDGDGSISKDSVKITSGSISFLEGIKLLLTKLNITSGKIIRDNKVTNTYSVRICGKENIIRLYKIIYSKSKYYYKYKFNSWKTNIFK